MELNSTKYSNNIRQVSGTPIIYKDDVVLECDTTVGPVVINLLTIPADFWNTTWKLYIVDVGNNASANHITINAGSGQTINGASSVAITISDGSALIRIASNNSFVSTFSFSSSIGNGHIIQDEGVSLPQQPILNFVGAGVTATDAGGKTQVFIPGSALIPLTNAAMLSLIGANTVVPGQGYLITDAGLATGGGVIVQGSSANAISVQGTGLFLNADYQQVGNYSGVIGFGSNLGIWSLDVLTVSQNDVVIWNNLHYKNLTNNWGSFPDSDTVNWEFLPLLQTNGYILECDFVKYNVTTNSVIYRADKRLNEVEYNVYKGLNVLTYFQWGRDLCTYNKVFGASQWHATNSNCTIVYNTLNSGLLSDETKPTNAGTIGGNTIFSNGLISIINNQGSCNANNVSNGSTISIFSDIDINCQVNDNILTDHSQIQITNVLSNCQVNGNNLYQISVLGGLGATCNGGKVNHNTINNKGVLKWTVLSATGFILDNEVSDENTVLLGAVNTNYEKFKICSGFSNWEVILDYSDVSIFSGTSVTIPLTLKYAGVFKVINSAGTNTLSIINPPTNHPFVFKPDAIPALNKLKISFTSVGVALNNNVIANATIVNTNGLFVDASYRLSGGDTISLSKVGNFVGCSEANIWQ